jgi:hypothetical protein
LDADGVQNPHHEVSGCGEVRLGVRARAALLGQGGRQGELSLQPLRVPVGWRRGRPRLHR